MTERQLADRIGAIDEKLVSSAGKARKKRRVWPRITAVAAALAVIAGLAVYLTGRTPAVRAEDLMAGYSAKTSADPSALTEDVSAAVAELGLELLRADLSGKNGLVSPVSVASALGMTAMGARGETLKEMSSVLGAEPEALAKYLRAYRESLNGGVHMANSVWLRDDPELHVEPEFLQANADYYSAGAYKSAFDKQTVEDINNWTKTHTGGMIDKLLDRIPDEAVMYLVNALSFEAEWTYPYKTEDRVHSAVFTTDDGDKREVKMMYSSVEDYFSDDCAQGFLKHYKNGCAFAAILPNAGVSVDEYLASLTGEKLRGLLTSAGWANGTTGIPKFELERDYELAGALISLGMPSAFDDAAADFTGMGRGRNDANLFISRVLHKTFIEVGERGTRAGAVTSVETANGAAPLDPVKQVSVYLDRPFIFAIVDTATMTPLFIGVVRDIGK